MRQVVVFVLAVVFAVMVTATGPVACNLLDKCPAGAQEMPPGFLQITLAILGGLVTYVMKAPKEPPKGDKDDN